MTDVELLEALQKGGLMLKLRKLRALGYIEGPMLSLRLRLTPDGEAYVKQEQGKPVVPCR